MTELTFTAGPRATLDLRDSAGDVTIKDWDGATIKVEAEESPYVLREQDTFRLRLAGGGTISLPIGLPADVMAPARVRVRVMRAGGETDVRSVAEGAASDGARSPEREIGEFADAMADFGRRIARDVARGLRTSGADVPEDLGRKFEEAAERIARKAEQQATRAAEHYERHAARVAAHAERHAERAVRHAERAAQRTERAVERGARRGRWWFTERMDEWTRQGGPSQPPAPRATEEERVAIMQMLRDGKITAEQAATLLDALGG